jgi:hypothetical protein
MPLVSPLHSASHLAQARREDAPDHLMLVSGFRDLADSKVPRR